ncbi:class I SAM-dependent methyltransferase [Microbacterium sp. SA39]|uniref:class I SAM-dependent methyltransferase n=1 Tax=Microbacterium sp. SA39 TaxID=1263625 RepID=UPI00061EEBE1|nr:class I SAM-dependent methyltransferase [Microbacterium sp. SA39]KJQ52959.1 putative methyltransferase YcgJ [Microbacterium sp. SA39]
MVDEVLARSFENIGDEYDRYRPGFPPQAAKIIIPSPVDSVLDLGAGTGKFTRLLQKHAQRVIAVEPSVPMMSVLQRTLPGVDARRGTAESIPSADSSVDAVTVAQAFHWFDRDSACAEIARVLVPGGTLGLVWNRPDPTCAWDLACHRIAHPAVSETDATADTAAEELPGFTLVRQEQVRWVEHITRDHYVRRWSTISSVIVAEQDRRDEMLAAVDDVLDAAPQTSGLPEFELPHLTDVFVYRRS